MTRVAVKLTASIRVKALIIKELNKRQLEKHYSLRMQIIQKGSTDIKNQEISSDLSCSVDTVMKWRKRWKFKESYLLKFEEGYAKEKVTDKSLLIEVKKILSDEIRSGAPARLTVSEITRLQALACESPEKYELPFSVWTHKELSKQAKEKGIIISSSHYGKILKKRIASA